MDGRFSNQFTCKHEEPGITSEYSGDFHFSASIPDGKMNSISSPKRSRRAVQKRVVSIPIGDVHGSRLKGGDGAPPSDSWAWRKYGQKPIKGSPYPRGYYRCSSSKGCPARKQVERSRVDPTMLVITYACEHNHPGPASRNPNSTTNPANKTKTSTTTITTTPKEEEEPATTTTVFTTDSSEDKFGADLTDESLITTDDFNWFSDVGSTSPLLLESSICAGNSGETDADVAAAMIFPMGEEDESLFADLGELPECSVVFRRGCMEQQEERRRCSLRAG